MPSLSSSSELFTSAWSLRFAEHYLVIIINNALILRVHGGAESHGKRKLWLLFTMVAWQPLVMFWLTYSLIPSYTLLASQGAGLPVPGAGDTDQGF